VNDTRNGKIYGALFLFFIVILIVGGYVLTVKITKEDNNDKINTSNNEKEEENVVVSDKYKIDKTKEYLYFENIDSKSLEHEIIYQDIIININSNDAKNLETKLNNEMTELRKTYKKLSEQEISEEDEEKILYKEDDIYSTSFKKYTRYFYKNYTTLLVDSFDYDCFNGSAYKSSISYVFDINTGKILTKKELLNIYNKNLDSLKSRVKETLESEQTEVEGTNLIDITSTINSFDNDDNYALYINKSGFLAVSFLVKTTQIDYNDVIILN